jgi:dephospho-CoA kinase
VRIVGVAGAIGSGKSELSRALADERGGSRVTVGDFVRGQAEARGIEPARENLQALGEQQIDELGAPEFVRRVLSDYAAADVLVVDGVRHLPVDDELRKISAQYLLIFVEVDDETRRMRLRDREGHEVDLLVVDRHSTERDVPLLRKRADAIVDGADSASALERVRALWP